MSFDAIVVGARVAGSPTAMLLARHGHRVLLVDKATFPSDVLSTHLLHVPAMACLREWGLLDAVVATGAPPHERFTMDFGPFTIAGPPPAVDGVAHPYCVRRTRLDKILVDAARAAGAEVREGFAVDGLLRDDTGRVTGVTGPDGPVEAKLVIGADGLRSIVARETGAGTYHDTPSLTACYYAYYRGVSGPGAEIYQLGDRAVVVFPTNDGLACVFVACPIERFHEFRTDVEGHYLEAISRVPALAARVAAGERVERIRGTADVPNFFRESSGPGWALVGDAGYHKDPCMASGITDAFVCARLLADAVHAALSGDPDGERELDAAVAGYVRARDERFLPALRLTCQLASMEPPSPETAALFATIAASPAESTRFFGVLQGSTPIPSYFDPANIGRIMSGAS
ncbi:NAD(P)/FAD-dependent oxidoreductase [Dactylosporangium roseum]|uniref:NAD(P)/FAD-dependent oxidoreductase n=1 Tax=Dactylosporangium roseum TaxID=47989 RepID=A0ABY5Z9Q9_9ACTN|nr:NAD(P)/FAD-dependent oxidoreductase [Dactylosporangium roseum]UWZ38828.1 NAD(P)/FAD-dependent oxidoreductase [Dactylosporangium roseum]